MQNQYGLLGYAQDQFNESLKGLDSAAQGETQRNIENKQIREQEKAGKAQLGATIGGAAGTLAGAKVGVAIGGEAGGPYGAAAGALVGAIAGTFGSRLF